MQDNRVIWITSYSLSAFTLMTHFLLLFNAYIVGTGMLGDSDLFTRQFFQMHFSVYWPLFQFLLIAVIAYALFAGMIGYCVLLLRQWGIQKIKPMNLTIRCWILMYCVVIIINSDLFPNSLFASGGWLSSQPSGFSLDGLHACVLIFCATLLVAGVIAVQKLMRHKIIFGLLLLIIVGFVSHILYVFYKVPDSETVRLGYHNKRPNVIIIYYCSFMARYLENYPHFKSFAEHSVWFRNVVSPTARTAPGTFEFLSGLYPTHSHFFDNLNWRDSRIPYHQSIANTLQKTGYQTIFMTNINEFRRLDSKLNWGFEEVISPPTNIIELLLNKFNDLPLTNLLFCFPTVDKYLFPLNYANASDNVHYMLSTYLSAFKNVLNHQLTRKPVFLVLNDESLHFPYVTANIVHRLYSTNNRLERYKVLMGLVDQQFSRYLAALKKHHLLNNAIVILAADHGESPGLNSEIQKVVRGIAKNSTDDQLILRKKMKDADVVYGHGADVMLKEQYHVPLIFHFYGNNEAIKMPQINHALNSSVDFAPTLLQLLNMPMQAFDGQSLVPEMQGKTEKPVIIYLNASSFVDLPKDTKELKQLVNEQKSNYRVLPDGSFGMSLKYLTELKKQFPLSVCWKNFGMGYYPPTEENHKIVPALFFLMNEKNDTVDLFTQTELNQFLKHPDEKKLKALDMNVRNVQYLLTHLMQYCAKVLLSAKEVPKVRKVD